MISEKLQQARAYEQNALRTIDSRERPEFHMTGGVGWINDPNGFSCYRRNPVSYRDVAVSEETELEGIRGRILDLTVTIRAGDYREFTVYLAKGEDLYTTVTILPQTGEARIDRTCSGFAHDIVHSRSFPVDTKGDVTVRVIMDRFSVELFFNGGKQTAAMTLYTPETCDGIRFAASGSARIDVEKYDLQFD